MIDGAKIAAEFVQYMCERGAHEEAVYGDRNIAKGTEDGYAAERAAECTDLYRDIWRGLGYIGQEFNAGDALTPNLTLGEAHAVAIYYGLRSPVASHRQRMLKHVAALKAGTIDIPAELERGAKAGGGSHPTPQYIERKDREIAAYVNPIAE